MKFFLTMFAKIYYGLDYASDKYYIFTSNHIHASNVFPLAQEIPFENQFRYGCVEFRFIGVV